MVIERAEVGAMTSRASSAISEGAASRSIVRTSRTSTRRSSAAAVGDRWRDRLRAAAYAAARYIDARPIQTRFDMIQMLGVGDMAQAYRDRYLGRIVNLIDEGREELPDPDSMSRDVAIGVFGSIYQFLLKELHDRRAPVTAESFVPQLMYIAVRPYFGHDAALEELRVEPPPPAEMDGTERRG